MSTYSEYLRRSLLLLKIDIPSLQETHKQKLLYMYLYLKKNQKNKMCSHYFSQSACMLLLNNRLIFISRKTKDNF